MKKEPRFTVFDNWTKRTLYFTTEEVQAMKEVVQEKHASNMRGEIKHTDMRSIYGGERICQEIQKRGT